MFIDYQKVRNAAIALVAAVGTGTAAIFGFGEKDPVEKAVSVAQVPAIDQPVTEPAPDAPLVSIPTKTAPQNFVAETVTPAPPRPKPKASPKVAQQPKPIATSKNDSRTMAVPKPKADSQRYAEAMKLALGTADKSGTAKDVLGPASPWKLNLYDDNLDGQYDRGKLDRDRDDIEDEKWTFKKGRWEKDGGDTLWIGGRWTKDAVASKSSHSTAAKVSPELQRYRAAMKIATSRADKSGKGKDVLGPRSPWKLNLYDDNKDGRWDRAKLDTNRDDKDDEKWNFKKGRWEKDGGATIWTGDQWQAE